jgi:hypothetical protein
MVINQGDGNQPQASGRPPTTALLNPAYASEVSISVDELRAIGARVRAEAESAGGAISPSSAAGTSDHRATRADEPIEDHQKIGVDLDRFLAARPRPANPIRRARLLEE